MALRTNTLCVDFKYSMANYNTNCFMALECETVYYKDLMRKKLLLERGIFLKNVTKKILAFYGRLEAMG